MHPELKKCLIAGESEKLDFKESITNAHKIAKTIVSFANHEGGVILVGIRDNKTIAGIIPEEERFMLQLAVTRYCRPMIRLHYQEVVEGKKTVLFVKIEQGSNKPYKALDDSGKWRAYLRVDDSSMLASKVWFKAMIKKKKSGGKVEFGEHEKEVLHMLSTSTLNFSTLKENMALQEPALANLLSNLIYLGFIKIVFIDKQEFYTQSI